MVWFFCFLHLFSKKMVKIWHSVSRQESKCLESTNLKSSDFCAVKKRVKKRTSLLPITCNYKQVFFIKVRYSGCTSMYGKSTLLERGEGGRIFPLFTAGKRRKSFPPSLINNVGSLQLPPISSYFIWGFWMSIAMKMTCSVHCSAIR